MNDLDAHTDMLVTLRTCFALVRVHVPHFEITDIEKYHYIRRKVAFLLKEFIELVV
jgi:hypothetical protein